MKRIHGLTKFLTATAVACVLVVGLTSRTNAATVGAGIQILNLPGANNTFDTPSNGSNDQSRQNIDKSFTVTLPAGTYEGTTWSFRAGQTGSVTPYIAKSTGAFTYEILAVGDQVDLLDTSLLNLDIEGFPFGGSSFTLASDTQIFGGIVNPKTIGSQNPIYTNLNSGSLMDHDNNNDGNLSPPVVGGAVSGFGHTNLPRSYAFSIEVERVVPEPTAGVLAMMFVGLAVMKMRRR